MNKPGNGARFNRQIVDEAAEWFVELNAGDGDSAAQRRFDAWLRKSPEHVRAYLAMFPLWEDAALVDSKRAVSSAELIASARADGNVVPLAVAPPHEARARSHSSKRFLLAASLAGVCVLAGIVAWIQISSRGTYATDIGEQRVIALADGSSIELNALSRVRVRFSEAERDVDLLAGQALFRVAKDRSRPFVVRGGVASVRAVGTQFDVYRRKDSMVVTVLEGRVAVPLAKARGDIEVSAGEQILVSPEVAPAPPKHVNVESATAWRKRQLVFRATPLREVAEEFNRYNERKLVVADARIESLQINGVFSSTEPASLIRFLRAQPDLHVDESDTEIRITSR
ncbi:MAG: FecR domain-containing protein [Gammaproteobacteria bacterium]